ncbi:hypothetical protein D8674_001515 [Pyrus ussuriensis x Pyrus communis]|uniref:Uncharacterized protein n=1 Tax=Pyrus ussuriensis x Pyrus communis TaxID=2448454 RepID=A0A5N5F6G9_9ROSA|nr:hypothetical protein D8674_001515 [Pyrus ussuriensis x Pyrus communis]
MRRSSGEGNSSHGLPDPRRVLRRKRRVSVVLVFSESPNYLRVGSDLLLHFFCFRFVIAASLGVDRDGVVSDLVVVVFGVDGRDWLVELGDGGCIVVVVDVG